MWLIFLVAGIAILQRHREVTEATGIYMALNTGQSDVFARELERKDIVIEILSEAIHTIVTIEAGGTEGQRVRGHESLVNLTVAGIAGIQGEGCDIAMMAVSASERHTPSRLLVPFQ